MNQKGSIGFWLVMAVMILLAIFGIPFILMAAWNQVFIHTFGIFIPLDYWGAFGIFILIGLLGSAIGSAIKFGLK